MQSMGFPIPNIKEMFLRLGAKRAKYYAKCDLTSGYHQMPISPAVRSCFAFICSIGCFEWLRVPMGPKAAGSYFQSVMATIVLAGILYIICELYMDDVVIFGDTFDEFLNNFVTVLHRFKKYGLLLNPEKCHLGYKQIQYVGKIIDENGISMSREKRDVVKEFQKPTTMKDLKSFLGLANYFRDHIRNHSTIVKPLHDLLHDYERTKRLKWTTQSESAFEMIKQKIDECPTLFFMNDTDPVYLLTDASEYGVGAYLFQVIDGVEVPAVFLSKSLSPEQQRWTVPEKEAYAIYWAFTELDYLIRDRHFTLKTDHQNLTYINSGPSAKVLRWKLAIQSYDFDIEHIPGADNIVADAFSRLCNNIPMTTTMINNETDETIHHISSLKEHYKIPHDKYKLISAVHNSTAGHHGVEKTIEKLQRQNHDWQYMREHVKRFIKLCPCCQKASFIRVPVHTYPFTAARYEPFERLYWDTIGPLPKDDDGNMFFLVIIDAFTRFVELYPVKDTTAKCAAECLFDLLGRYGAPCQLVNDNGTQFVNNVITELLKLVGTEHIMTLAYSKEENGLVERANKEVNRHLRALIFHKNVINEWSKNKPLIQRIINATKSDLTQYCPADLLFGTAISLDRGIFLPHEKSNNEVELSEWAHKRLLAQQAILNKSKEIMKNRDDEHMASKEHPPTRYEINTYVLAKYPTNNLRDGPPEKYKLFWRGPYKITSSEGDEYTLLNLVNNKEFKLHVTQLKPYLYDPESTDPRTIALKDQHFFDVEKILKHKGNIKRKNSLSFLVRWIGYGPEDDQWIKWSELRTNIALHNYLKEHNLKTLIPTQFK
jgi:cleavage and polyadenylation specificity factor subunit 1